MRHKMLTVSILAATLSAFVFGAAAQLSPQNPQGQANPGTPGGGYGWMCGSGMMGYGYGMGPGMMGRGTMSPGYGMGPGMTGWGNAQQRANLNLSVSDVKSYLDRWIAMRGNPHLKAGPITEKDANTITADVVTTEKDALVERFSVDRHTGYWQAVR